MRHRQRTPFWLWMNLLSLDAPLVALVWQDFLTRCYPSMLRPAGRWTLGLTVWAIYLADHLIDLRSAEPTSIHGLFYRRHQRLARGVLIALVGAATLISAFWLRHSVFMNGLLVGAAVCLYLGIFAAARVHGPWKSRAAAILFTAGVFLVAWTGTAQPAQNLGWPAAVFCALCWGNLTLIRHWSQQRNTVGAGIAMLGVATICVLAGRSPWYSAAALSASAMALLALEGHRFATHTRRVLADALLLSPLLFLWR